MKPHLTKEYFNYLLLVFEVLGQMNNRNLPADRRLLFLDTTSLNDDPTNSKDRFVASIHETYHDRLMVPVKRGTISNTDYSLKTQWFFQRQNDDWKLSSITPNGAPRPYYDQKFQKFVDTHNFLRGGGFGWQTLPSGGIFYRPKDFEHSRLDFHAIGRVHDQLVQVYQYTPILLDDRNRDSNFIVRHVPGYIKQTYIVAQVTLPKSYHVISIRRRALGFDYKPDNTESLKVEGTEFSRKYDVYIDKRDRIAALELLNPLFMHELLELNYEINIEVVDSTMYAYSSDSSLDYESMIKLLIDAYRDLRL